jgi:hypothetical protein
MNPDYLLRGQMPTVRVVVDITSGPALSGNNPITIDPVHGQVVNGLTAKLPQYQYRDCLQSVDILAGKDTRTISRADVGL